MNYYLKNFEYDYEKEKFITATPYKETWYWSIEGLQKCLKCFKKYRLNKTKKGWAKCQKSFGCKVTSRAIHKPWFFEDNYFVVITKSRIENILIEARLNDQ